MTPTVDYHYAAHGFQTIGGVYTSEEIAAMLTEIAQVNPDDNPVFRKTTDLFAIRQFLKEFPALCKVIFNDRLRNLIQSNFGDKYFPVKSIYFDKPGASNWFVAWHQDLTISVKDKKEVSGYGPWTVKHHQFAVQPPLEILQDNFTIRIHLDDTDGQNGALKVIPGSHLKGICRPETIDWQTEREVSCALPAGGVMLMSPLLMHASSRTTDDRQRRVIHIEFSRADLAQGLEWSERIDV